MARDEQDRLDLPMDDEDLFERIDRDPAKDLEADDTTPAAREMPDPAVDQGLRENLNDPEATSTQLDDSRPAMGATPEMPSDEERDKGFGEYIKEKYQELKDDLE